MLDLMLCYSRKTLLSCTEITLPLFYFFFLFSLFFSSEGQYFQHTLTTEEKSMFIDKVHK